MSEDKRHTLSEMWRRTSAYGLFLTVCFFCIAGIFTYLQMETGSPAVSTFFKSVSVLADSFLLILPFAFIKKGWRLTLCLLIPLLALTVFANVLYFRNFSDLIPASLYFSDISDGFILRSAAASLRLPDIMPAAAAVIPLIVLAILRPRKICRSAIGRFFRLTVILMTLLMWGLSFIGAARRVAIYAGAESPGKIVREMFAGSHTRWESVYRLHNFSGYSCYCLIRTLSGHHTLSEEEYRDIVCHLTARLSPPSPASPLPADSLYSPRNLVVIVVESLPSAVFDMEGAHAFMPGLARLANDSASLFVKECRVMAGAGRSSDAQFMFNTGLLPLREEPLVTDYASADYPSLAKAFRGPSIEIFGENKALWSHGLTSRSYGFRKTVGDIADTPYRQDSIIFRRASEEVGRLGSPFFLFLSTLSMHDPYVSSAVSDTLPEAVVKKYPDARDREYLRRLSHCDRHLSLFLDGLKQQNLYDNTLIVITGDHEIREDAVSAQLKCPTVPLLILNLPEGLPAARLQEVRASGKVTQADIFPTVLGLLGIRYEYDRFKVPYSGLGNDLFSPAPPHPVDEKDYEISALIIRSR